MGWFNPTDQSSPWVRPGPGTSPRKARVRRFRGIGLGDLLVTEGHLDLPGRDLVPIMGSGSVTVT